MDLQPIQFLTALISVISLIFVLLRLRRERVGRSPRRGTGVVLRIRPPRLLVGPTTMVEGYDNGVVCLSGFNASSSTSAAIQLWNPSRKQLRQLPPPPAASADSNRRNTGFRLGVGRDPSTGDLKVVRVCSPTAHEPGEEYFFNLFVEGTQVWVYTLSADSWRSIEWTPLVDLADPDCTVQFTSCNRRRSVVVNSCVHWSATYKLSRPGQSKWISKFGIFAFDLATEAFRIVHPPQEVAQAVVKDGLAELSGRLALIARIEDSVNIWVMKQYGDSASWTKQVSFNFSSLNLLIPKCWFRSSNIELASNGHAQISTFDGIIDFDLNTLTVLSFTQQANRNDGFPIQQISPSDTTSLFPIRRGLSQNDLIRLFYWQE